MIEYTSHLGVPWPPGTEFRQRLMYDAVGPYVVSIVEAKKPGHR